MRWHPNRDDPTAQVFPISYAAFGQFLKHLSHKALRKHITPHLVRHSGGIWLASNNVGRYEMCKLMSWAISPDMRDRYIDRLGVVEQKAIAAIRGDGSKQA